MQNTAMVQEINFTSNLEEIRKRVRRFLYHLWSSMRVNRSKLAFFRGKDYRVWDIDSKSYIDCCSLNSTCGYANHKIAKFVYQQLLKFYTRSIFNLPQVVQFPLGCQFHLYIFNFLQFLLKIFILEDCVMVIQPRIMLLHVWQHLQLWILLNVKNFVKERKSLVINFSKSFILSVGKVKLLIFAALDLSSLLKCLPMKLVLNLNPLLRRKNSLYVKVVLL